MSETLKERLNSHSNSFEGLLSLIPAKYYFNDESSNQWNKKKGTKADHKRAKRAKLDPDAGSSALDESNRRAQLEHSDSDDSEVAVLFDDYGNEVFLSDRPQSSEDEDTEPPAAPKLRANGANKLNGGSQPVQAKATQVPDQQKKAPAKSLPVKAKAKDQSNPTPESLPAAPQNASGSDESNGPSPGEDGPEDAHGTLSTGKRRKGQPLRDSAGIQELRDKIAAKVEEMRAQRKAPGSAVKGAPKNREELLRARKERQEQRKLKRKREEPEAVEDDLEEAVEGSPVNSADAGIESAQEQEDGLMFGGVHFGDGQKLGRNMELDEQKQYKKRNAVDQLKVLQNRKSKFETLGEEKKTQVAQNSSWSTAVLRSEGVKVRDDEKMLKKTVKQQQKRKLKSEMEWRERKENVAKGIASREAKRNANLQARKESKGLKGKSNNKNKKGGKPKGRAGFEGKGKRRKT